MRADKTGGVHTIVLFAELRPTQGVAQSMWVDRNSRIECKFKKPKDSKLEIGLSDFYLASFAK